MNGKSVFQLVRRADGIRSEPILASRDELVSVINKSVSHYEASFWLFVSFFSLLGFDADTDVAYRFDPMDAFVFCLIDDVDVFMDDGKLSRSPLLNVSSFLRVFSDKKGE